MATGCYSRFLSGVMGREVATLLCPPSSCKERKSTFLLKSLAWSSIFPRNFPKRKRRRTGKEHAFLAWEIMSVWKRGPLETVVEVGTSGLFKKEEDSTRTVHQAAEYRGALIWLKSVGSKTGRGLVTYVQFVISVDICWGLWKANREDRCSCVSFWGVRCWTHLTILYNRILHIIWDVWEGYFLRADS